jgi:biopolymer transport protein ExbD
MAAISGPKDNNSIIAEINVTPLVDITLVLLIIFMIASPLIMAPAIRVDLPRATNADDSPQSTLGLILTRQGQLYLNGTETTYPNLKEFISTRLKEKSDLQAVISADQEVSHGRVIHLIDVIKGLGIEKFALNIDQVTDTELVKDEL